jgi:hypothetical protein
MKHDREADKVKRETGLRDPLADPAAEKSAQPRKVEGDALLSGTGTRHGVQRADERPRTEGDEGLDRD